MIDGAYTVEELIADLTIDCQNGKPIDSKSKVEILTGWNEKAYILSIYMSGDKLCIDIGDE